MLSLVYVSSASHAFTDAELAALLKQSREKNQRLGVTGMLLYDDGNFLQVLEGPDEAVRSLYATIAGDGRHSGVMCLMERRIEEREFGEWSMAFRNLRNPDVRKTPGYSEYLNDASVQLADHPQRAQRLIEVFRSHLR